MVSFHLKMSAPKSVVLAGSFLGAAALGIAVVLITRLHAFTTGGDFQAFWPLMGATFSTLLSSAMGLALFGRSRSKPSSVKLHDSMLSDVARDAALADRQDLPLLLVGGALLVTGIVPTSLLLRLGAGSGGAHSLMPFLLGMGGCAAALGAAAGHAVGRGSDRGRGLALLLASLTGGMAGGWVFGAHLAVTMMGLNERAVFSIILPAGGALICLFASGLDRWTRPILVGLVVLGAGRFATWSYAKLDAAYERLTPTEETRAGERFAHVVENRHGAVTVTTAGVLHQNGQIQGIFNTSPVVAADVNRCSRAYVIPSIIKEPKRILALGLGSGSFAQILAHHPEVEKIVILEDNPAYRRAVLNSGLTASLIANQKVELIDGNPLALLAGQGKFDVIIQDRIPFRKRGPSPYLTKEHLKSLATHLTPNGAVYVNTGESDVAERTLLEVFPHLLRYQDMIFGSEKRLRVDGYHWMRQLMAWKIDGTLVLSTHGDATEIARAIVKNRDFRGAFAWEREDAIRERTKKVRVLGESDLVAPWWHISKLP